MLSDNRGYGVVGQIYDATGEVLGGEFQVNSYTSSDQRAPAVAVFPEGDFVAVWESRGQDGGGFGVFGQHFDADGARLGSEFLVDTVTSGAQRRPDVAIGADGDVVVVWDSAAPASGGTDVITRRFDRNLNPQNPGLRVNQLATNSQRLPSIASTGDAFIVVWETTADDEEVRGIAARRLDGDGQPTGSEFIVNSYTDGGQRRPIVAADAEGGFLVVWDNLDQDGSGRGVYAQRYDASAATVGSEFQVNTYTTGGQLAAVPAFQPSGSFVVSWQSASLDGSAAGIFGRRFDAAGAPRGTEFQINNFTTSSQTAPAIAGFPSGRFVVAWSSFGQDGEADGVFAQRLGAPIGTEYRVSTTTVGEQSAPTIGVNGDRVVILWHSRAHCFGDCDDNGEVGINELVRGVNIVLGTRDPDSCLAIDPDGNQVVTIAELVRAVNSLIGGCPP